MSVAIVESAFWLKIERFDVQRQSCCGHDPVRPLLRLDESELSWATSFRVLRRVELEYIVQFAVEFDVKAIVD